MSSEFDKSKIYDSQLKPLITTFSQICKRERIPFFLSVMIRSHNNGDETETEYRREAAVKETFGYDIDKDEIGFHLAVASGFPVLFERQMEIDVSDDDDGWDMTEEEYLDLE